MHSPRVSYYGQATRYRSYVYVHHVLLQDADGDHALPRPVVHWV